VRKKRTRRRSPKLAAAVALLRREVPRVPRSAKELLALARERDISPRTLRRARREMGNVVTQKRGFRAGWAWALHEGELWGPG